MRPDEHSVAKCLDQVAVRVELEDWRLCPMQRPNMLAVRIGFDRDHVAPLDVRRQLCPALDVGVVIGSELDRALGAGDSGEPDDDCGNRCD